MSKMIVSLIAAYQEHQYFLKQAVESIWEFSDKIIIVDGSPFGPSTDGTKAWAQSLDKNKVVFQEGTFTNLHEQKNVAMTLGLQYSPDYFFTCDADEIYREDDLHALRVIVEADNAPPIVMFKMYHTWKDLIHFQTGGPFSNPFIRLFKVVSGIHYNPPPAGDEPQDDQGRYLKIDKHYVADTLFLGKPLTFHVGHSKTIWHEFLKVLRYAKWESATLEGALHRIGLNGWFDDKNIEGVLNLDFPKTLVDYKDKCEGCPKTRHLINYCKNECPIGKTLEYEKCMYDIPDLKEELEKAGISQKAR